MVFSVPELPYSLSFAREVRVVSDLTQVFKETEVLFDYLALPLISPHLHLTPAQMKNFTLPMTRTDTILRSKDWSRFIIGQINDCVDGLASPSEHVKAKSEFALTCEIKYAMHLNIYAILIPFPRSSSLENYARIVNGFMKNDATFIMRVPARTTKSDSWALYQKFKNLCGNSPQLSVFLELSAELPEELEMRRWLGERIAFVSIDTSLFAKPEADGKPTLPDELARTLCMLFRHKVQVSLKSKNQH